MTPDRALATGMVLVLGALAALVVYALLAVFVLHGEVTATSLRDSLENSAGSVEMPGSACRRAAGARRWTCPVGDSGGSGGVTYVVTVRARSSCWDARLTSSTGESMPRTVSGCVTRWEPSLI